MRTFRLFWIAGAILFICAAQGMGQTRETKVRSYPVRSYEERNDPKDYIPGNKDWVVLFEKPEGTRAHVVFANGGTENQVLRNSLIDPYWQENGRNYVKVLTGARARKDYNGNIRSWASSLYMEYLAPMEPRGPDNRRRRP